MVKGVGRVLRDRYRFDRELGRRGQVVTWLVTDLRNASPCVLKVLSEAEAPTGEAPTADARLFEAQADVLAGLDHPGLPRFIEHFIEVEGIAREHVLITRFHPGESLGRLVAKGRLLTEAQAVALLRRLVPVLAYLHGFAPPLVHRSIKPSNLIIGPDSRPCLTDLHFAVEREGWKAWEEPTADASYLSFAAPEAERGGAVPASDIYAIGLAVLYGMTGQDPVAIAREGRLRIREATRAGESLATILAHMLEPTLERRYPDAQALEADLARLATGRSPSALAPVAAPADGAPKPAGAPAPAATPAPATRGPAEEPRRGSPLRLAALAGALIAVGALLWLNTQRNGGQAGESLMPPPAPTRSEAPPATPAEPPAPAPAEPPTPAPAAPEPAEPPAPAPDAPAPAASPAEPAAPAAAAAPEAPAGTPAGTPAVDTAAAGPVVVEGRLLFDGQPVTRITSLQPTFWFRNEATRTPEKPQVEYRDGTFRVRGLPAGRMGVSMRINLEPGNPNLYPGDLDAWTTFVVGEGPPPVLEINMRKVMRLQQPVDNNVVIRGWDEPCGAGNVHPRSVVFAWEPLDRAATYEVAVNRLACGRNYASAGRALTTSTAEPWVKVDLEPSAAGECYSFRLTASRDGRPIGMFTTHGRNGLGWDYRFTVK